MIIDIEEGRKAVQAREIPEDLFIPPDAMEVITQCFEGPLDLLLYLIRKNRFDVLDIPVAEIAEQYATYIDLMQEIQLDIAGDYLAMAATLAQIKSRMLLPPKQTVDDDEEDFDPRLELARRLQEYEQIAATAEKLNERPRVGREIFVVQAQGVEIDTTEVFEKVGIAELIEAFRNVIISAERDVSIVLQREVLSVRERVDAIRNKLKSNSRLRFDDLFDRREGRAGLVVAFLAILELVNSGEIHAVQADTESAIHIQRKD